MINQVLAAIKRFLDDDVMDAVEFSIWLEDVLCEEYEVMEAEHAEITEILNEDLPDICAAYERGDNIVEFKERIQSEYERVIELYSEG